MRKFTQLMALTLAVTLFMSACNNKTDGSDASDKQSQTTKAAEQSEDTTAEKEETTAAESEVESETSGEAETTEETETSEEAATSEESESAEASESVEDSESKAEGGKGLTANPLTADEDVDALLTPAEGSVHMLASVTGGKDADEMVLFQETLSKMTGLEVTIERPASEYDTVLMQKLGANEKLDLIQFNAPAQYALIEQAVLSDLTDRIAASPILSGTEIIPEVEWDQIRVDGKLYAGFNKKEVMRLPVINKVIAEKAGIDVTAIEPTLDGYYETMKAMKEVAGDDFYGLNLVLADAWDLQPWFSSVGIKTGMVQTDAGIDVPMSSSLSKPVWEWLKKLYDEGLLDPDAATNKSSDMRNKFQSGNTAVVTDWAAWVGLYNVNAADQYPAEFEAIGLPGVKGDADYMLARGDANLWGIPANAENADGAFRVIEFFATKHGGDLLTIGVEGHDWNVEGDEVVLTEIGASHGKDHGAPIPINAQYENALPLNPGFQEALEYLEYATPEVNNDKSSAYKEIVGRHAIQMVQGEVSIDEGLDAMRSELVSEGVITQ